MMKGKCNCGKKATSEFAVTNGKYCSTMKYCDRCVPKFYHKELQLIYGKVPTGAYNKNKGLV